MRGVTRPTPRQCSSQDRSGDRSAGHAGGVLARTAAVAVAVGVVALTAATPAGAQVAIGQLTSGQSVTAVSVAQSDPMVFGLGLAGLFWLLAGLLALMVGLVLATRRVHRGAAGGVADSRPATFTTTTRSTSISHDRAGGAEK